MLFSLDLLLFKLCILLLVISRYLQVNQFICSKFLPLVKHSITSNFNSLPELSSQWISVTAGDPESKLWWISLCAMLGHPVVQNERFFFIIAQVLKMFSCSRSLLSGRFTHIHCFHFRVGGQAVFTSSSVNNVFVLTAYPIIFTMFTGNASHATPAHWKFVCELSEKGNTWFFHNFHFPPYLRIQCLLWTSHHVN